MNVDEAMTELEGLGTEQNRKIYRRHGVRDDLFGVSYAHLKAMKKRIKIDQTLAEHLWATRNHDARILATMIADPNAIARKTLDAWSADLNCYPLSDALAGVAAASPYGLDLVDAWTLSDNEWVASTGWATLSHRVTKGDEVADDLLRAAAVDDRDNNRLGPESGASRDEQRSDRDRFQLQHDGTPGDRRRQTDRQGGGRPWRNWL